MKKNDGGTLDFGAPIDERRMVLRVLNRMNQSWSKFRKSKNAECDVSKILTQDLVGLAAAAPARHNLFAVVSKQR